MDLRRHVSACLITPLLFSNTLVVHAAFFQLAENSPAGMGSAFAGGAAIAEDASTVWYNPAGLTRLSGTQLLTGVYVLSATSQFNKSSATTAPLGAPLTGGNGGDSGAFAILPNIYFSHRLNDRLVMGVGVNVPFGLATDYQDHWVGRYHADRSEILTLNINPSIGYQVNDALSLGFGVSWQKMEAMLSQWADLGTTCALLAAPATCAGFGLVPQQDDARVVIEADSRAYGFNVGALWELNKQQRFGLAYRSTIKHYLTGLVDITTYDPGQAGFAANLNQVDGGANAYVTAPATLSMSTFLPLSPEWALIL